MRQHKTITTFKISTLKFIVFWIKKKSLRGFFVYTAVTELSQKQRCMLLYKLFKLPYFQFIRKLNRSKLGIHNLQSRFFCHCIDSLLAVKKKLKTSGRLIFSLPLPWAARTQVTSLIRYSRLRMKLWSMQTEKYKEKYHFS